MSPQWQTLVAQAAHEADRLASKSRSRRTRLVRHGRSVGETGAIHATSRQQRNQCRRPAAWTGELPRPQPRNRIRRRTLTPQLKKEWQEFYHDEAVLAFRRRTITIASGCDEKALYHRDPYSSKPGVKPFLPAPADFPTLPANACIDSRQMVDLTKQLSPDGKLLGTFLRALDHNAPGSHHHRPDERPAPQPGLGFETDNSRRPRWTRILRLHQKFWRRPGRIRIVKAA